MERVWRVLAQVLASGSAGGDVCCGWHVDAEANGLICGDNHGSPDTPENGIAQVIGEFGDDGLIGQGVGEDRNDDRHVITFRGG